MAQFDVYRNPSAITLKTVPFLLDLQSDLLSDLTTRVVAPLYFADAYGPVARHLNPILSVKGAKVVMSSAEIATVPKRALQNPIATLASARSEIVEALDFLFLGI